MSPNPRQELAAAILVAERDLKTLIAQKNAAKVEFERLQSAANELAARLPKMREEYRLAGSDPDAS